MKLGDNPCADCGAKENPIWWTDNVFWNEVMGRQEKFGSEDRRGNILCPICFIRRAEEKFDCNWRLIPDFPWKKTKDSKIK